METKEGIRQRLEAHYAANMPMFVDRAEKVSQHQIVPDWFFALAASECEEIEIIFYRLGALQVEVEQ